MAVGLEKKRISHASRRRVRQGADAARAPGISAGPCLDRRSCAVSKPGSGSSVWGLGLRVGYE